MTDKETMPEEYSLNELNANIRTHIPDFDMATAIMKRLHCNTAISKKALIELLEGKRVDPIDDYDEWSDGYNALIDELIKKIE